MDALIKYLLHASVNISLFYLVYYFFLRKDTYFRVNRFYLAGALLVSMILPLFNFNIGLGPAQNSYSVWLDPITISSYDVRRTVAMNLSFFQGALIVYLTGVSLFALRFLFQLGQLFRLVFHYGITRSAGMKVVFVDTSFSPFSFFNLIFISPEDYELGHSKKIIEHELVHIRQHHSVDLLLLEILTAILWFNPVMWMMRKSVKEVHEYLADEGVLINGMDDSEYQQALINLSMGVQLNDLTNNFSKSLLKKRMIMMTKSRSGTAAKLKWMVSFPAILAIVVSVTIGMNNHAFSQSEEVAVVEVVQEDGKPDKIMMKELPPQPPKNNVGDAPIGAGQEEEEVFKVVKVMPSFKGGSDKLIQYIVDNVKYPQDAKEKGKSGTVFVQFVVNKQGKITGTKVLRGVYPSLDQEALRVVKNMPDWNPGKDENNKAVNVEFNLPISFKLDSDKAEKKE